MAKGWVSGVTGGFCYHLKGAAFAAALAFAGAASAQEAPVAPPQPAEIAAPAESAVDPSLIGYERMAPTEGVGMPVPEGIAIQEQFTPIGVEGKWMLETLLNPIMGVISIFVLALLFWVIFRYRSAAVETPSTTTHNFAIEVIWTLVPAVILLAVAFPSFRLLANQYDPPKADVTVKVTGYQWYWGYEYPDYGGISFDSVPLSKEEAEKNGEPYLLGVDNRLVVPAGKTVKVLVTAADVLHSFALPSFWVKMDAVPGRINETWFKVDRPGVYYGQCSELCGTKHGFMPIAIEVLPEEDFKRWVRLKQQQDGIEPTGPGIAIAAAAPAAPQITVAPAEAPAA